KREGLLGLVERACRGIATGKAGDGGDVRRIETENLGIERSRGGRIAGSDGGFGYLQDFRDIRLAGSRYALSQLVDEGIDLALRHRAHEAVGWLAVDE